MTGGNTGTLDIVLYSTRHPCGVRNSPLGKLGILLDDILLYSYRETYPNAPALGQPPAKTLPTVFDPILHTT